MRRGKPPCSVGFDQFGNSSQTVEFEHLVAASLAFYLMGEGIEVAFISDDWQTGYGNSEGLLESILSYLAVVEMSPSAFPEVDVDAGRL
jgi:hypothetical protein